MDRGKPIKTKNVKKRRRTVRNAINIGLSANQDSFAAVSEQLSQTEQLTIDVNNIDRFSRSLDHLLPSFGPVETEPDENFSNFEPEDDCTKSASLGSLANAGIANDTVTQVFKGA